MPTRRRSRGRGAFVLVGGVAIAALLLGHDLLPRRYGFALAIESALPWTWVLIVGLVIIGAIRFSWLSVIGMLLSVATWLTMFGGALRPQPDTEPNLVVATQNVGARLPQPTATAQRLIDTGAQLVAVQEIDSLSGEIIEEQLDAAYPYSAVRGTVGLWSQWPMTVDQEATLDNPRTRSLVTTVHSDVGDLRVYVVHLPSVRPWEQSNRNDALRELARSVSEDDSARTMVIGDLNTATTDSRFSQLADQLTDSRAAVGGGFGFSWPSRFPVTRPSHVLVDGMRPVSDQVLERGTSDHRAIVAGLVVDS